jgi:galactose-1-phosphate uridylyltransferase
MNKLYTTDLKALNHILKNDYIYQKPEWFRYRIQEVIGEGLVVVEGDTHKHQVRDISIRSQSLILLNS